MDKTVIREKIEFYLKDEISSDENLIEVKMKGVELSKISTTGPDETSHRIETMEIVDGLK